jgi:hypothetical protein
MQRDAGRKKWAKMMMRAGMRGAGGERGRQAVFLERLFTTTKNCSETVYDLDHCMRKFKLLSSS